MTFAHPHFLWLLLLLPILAWLKGRRGRQPAFLYSSIYLVRAITGISKGQSGSLQKSIRWITLAFLIVGFARPRIDRSETRITASGVDIVIALDLSSSMGAEDFQLQNRRVNRVEIAKSVIKTFIEGRPSDRVGLIAFAGRAYTACPLTLEHEHLLRSLERLDLNMIEDGTAIGSAIVAGLNRLKEIESKSKILILMTDGQNTAGKMLPLTAAEAAQALGVKVYTIGVGTVGRAPFPYQDVFGRKQYQMREVDIDEALLKKISDMTKGRYFRAKDTETFETIYAEIDQMEKTETIVKKYHQYDELFYWAVGPGMALLLLEILLSHTLWRRLP